MDSIDITDPAFALDTNTVVNNLYNMSNISSTSMIMYVGILIVLLFVGMFIYRYYQNKKTNQSNKNVPDCPGGFCTM